MITFKNIDPKIIKEKIKDDYNTFLITLEDNSRIEGIYTRDQEGNIFLYGLLRDDKKDKINVEIILGDNKASTYYGHLNKENKDTYNFVSQAWFPMTS